MTTKSCGTQAKGRQIYNTPKCHNMPHKSLGGEHITGWRAHHWVASTSLGGEHITGWRAHHLVTSTSLGGEYITGC